MNSKAGRGGGGGVGEGGEGGRGRGAEGGGGGSPVAQHKIGICHRNAIGIRISPDVP